MTNEEIIEELLHKAHQKGFYNKITYSIKVYRKYKVKIIIQEKLYM